MPIMFYGIVKCLHFLFPFDNHFLSNNLYKNMKEVNDTMSSSNTSQKINILIFFFQLCHTNFGRDESAALKSAASTELTTRVGIIINNDLPLVISLEILPDIWTSSSSSFTHLITITTVLNVN